MMMRDLKWEKESPAKEKTKRESTREPRKKVI